MPNNLAFAFWGGASSLSFRVLSSLVEAGLIPAQINLGASNPIPARSKKILALQPAGELPLVELAQRYSIAVNTISREQNSTAGFYATGAKVNLLACYPFRLPQSVFAQPGGLFLNLHPSLLPANRGPDPVFWQLKNGADHIGVTLHELAEGFDSGDVMAQSSISAKDFPDAVVMEQRIAEEGVRLFVEILDRMNDSNELCRTPQLDDLASYQLMPELRDYCLDYSESVANAFRFANGVWVSGIQFFVKTSSGEKKVGQPLVWSNEESGAPQSDPNTIQFVDGWIQFAPAPR